MISLPLRSELPFWARAWGILSESVPANKAGWGEAGTGDAEESEPRLHPQSLSQPLNTLTTLVRNRFQVTSK